MRKRMIAGNWKMNKTFSEAIVLAQGIVDELSAGTGDVDVVVAPLLPLISKASLRFLLRQTLPLLFPHRMCIGRSPVHIPEKPHLPCWSP